MVNIVKLSSVQHSTVVMAAQGARAYHAARSGIEFGIHQALNAGICNASQTLGFQPADTSLQGFSVALQCALTSHQENTSVINVYTLTATASRGAYSLGAAANPDYVSRTIRVTVSNDPP